MTTQPRPDRAKTVELLRPWQATVLHHDCAYAEALIDTLIEGSQEFAAELAMQDATIERQDGELIYLRTMLAARTACPPVGPQPAPDALLRGLAVGLAISLPLWFGLVTVTLWITQR